MSGPVAAGTAAPTEDGCSLRLRDVTLGAVPTGDAPLRPLAQVTDVATDRLGLRMVPGLLGTRQLALRPGYATGTVDGRAGTGTPRRNLAAALHPAGLGHAGG